MKQTIRLCFEKTVSKQTSDRVKEALRAVMTDGTGVPANVEGYDIGGKNRNSGESFREGMETICFLLLDMHHRKNPEVVIYVVIDEPKCGKIRN